MCPACRAAEELRTCELSLVAGVAWGNILIAGVPPAIARMRVRELFCAEHADLIFQTSRLMKEHFNGERHGGWIPAADPKAKSS